MLRFRRPDQLAQIVARRERRPGRTNDNYSNGAIIGDTIQHRLQLGQHLQRQWIAFFRPIERQHRNARFGVELDVRILPGGLIDCCSHRDFQNGLAPARRRVNQPHRFRNGGGLQKTIYSLPIVYRNGW